VEEKMTLALEGIRVLDLTDGVAGPYAAMLLARCGAEVIRLESRRHLGFRENTKTARGVEGTPVEGGGPADFSKIEAKWLMTANFARYHFDKLSAELNLVKPEGRELFKKLLLKSDVVIDNFSFGVMQKWNFDYASLRQLKSDIIVVSMPSFGNGPHEQWTAWGMNLLSFTGFAYLWGHPDTPMEDRAANNTYGDYIAGTMAAADVLAALYHRAKAGEGQYIEISQTESTASLLSLSFLDYFINQRIAQPKGNRHAQFAPYNCYRCQGEDRWCVITVFNQDEWEQLRMAMDSPPWTQDPKFQTMESRLQNLEELNANIETWTRLRTPHQVTKILQSFDVAAGAVQNSEDLYFDLQLRACDQMQELDVFPHGRITFDRLPVSLSEGQKAIWDGAPVLGQHNNFVYRQLLGLSPADIDRLTKDNVIF
jgi:benzylsuccinate CoA-transferase BbsF subunit